MTVGEGTRLAKALHRNGGLGCENFDVKRDLESSCADCRILWQVFSAVLCNVDELVAHRAARGLKAAGREPDVPDFLREKLNERAAKMVRNAELANGQLCMGCVSLGTITGTLREGGRDYRVAYCPECVQLVGDEFTRDDDEGQA